MKDTNIDTVHDKKFLIAVFLALNGAIKLLVNAVVSQSVRLAPVSAWQRKEN